GARHSVLWACALAVAALIAFGKALSPQYLIWLVPLIPLLAGCNGNLGMVLFLGWCAVTQLWFPQWYWHFVNLEAGPTVLLIVRDALLIVLVGVLGVRAHHADRVRDPGAA